ncbi:hypothetical protein F2Q70_00026433 [Brassica cretica]|uniref:Uncharacterized protein n=1 Tax=Brassica cretica TaxID=69181 RepID=A0A8S9LE62_BRACR|nr:hypothetical protein F2Q70_00026433 [Brassica cretica]
MSQRSLSYSRLDEIDTGLQAQRSTLIQSQNKYMERPGEPRNRMPPLGNLTSENRTMSAARTVHQMGFSDPTRQARGYDPRRPTDADPQREDLGIPGETGTWRQRSWSSARVAGRCNGEAQSAHGSSEVAHQVSGLTVPGRLVTAIGEGV